MTFDSRRDLLAILDQNGQLLRISPVEGFLD